MLLFHLVIGSNPNPNIPHTKAQSIPAPPLSSQQQKAIDRYYRVLYAKLSESTMLAGGKHLTMLFNLIYKSLKYDNNQTRITAFIKRLLQVAFHSRTTPPILAASLFLISEIIPSHPYLKTISINQNVPFKLDVNSRDPNRAFVPTHSNHASSDANSDTCTEVNAIANADTCTEADTSRTQNNASLWELSLSASHFHPSVVKFAESVLTTDEGVQYKGDPLKDFSLGPFLDRFAYRHPKERLAKKDEDSTDKLLSVADTRKKRADDILRNRVLVNDPSFLASKNVPEELRFFRQYFEQRAKNDQIKETSAHVNPKPKDNIADSDQELMDSQHINWDSDSDEEAFANSVAIKLMEKSSGASGPVHYDNEDPEDLDDWSDYEGSDIGNEFQSYLDVDISDDDIDDDDENSDDDDDENSDDDDDDSQGGDGDEPRKRVKSDDSDDFMDNVSESEDEELENEPFFDASGDDQISSDEDLNGFGDGDLDIDDDENDDDFAQYSSGSDSEDM